MNSLTAPAYMFAEDIRLVVWDLDETFWRGTLTEGGVEIVAEHVEIVRALAARGVMSSICSKNDSAPVRDILMAQGLWDYFVLPDISWAPKGPRVKALIEQTQLRAASVLFIDDNPTNLAEVERLVSGVNLADEGVISHLLTHPQLSGNPDPELARLHHYKQMEKRKVAQEAASADPSDFLRASNITVTFEYDVAAHLPRVIELINRTNQLNFVKSRVSENPELAALTLQPVFEQNNYQCALVRVHDAYGDHGFCGFYIYDTDLRRLAQFCFSCRILGLGVEQWVYDKLGRPSLDIVGEVLSDPNTPCHVDWINRETGADGPMAVLPQAVTARGGCELGAVVHYFRTTSHDAVGEYPFIRNGNNVRLDHTVILHQALQGLTPEQKGVAAEFSFEAEDFQTRIFDSFPDGHAVILSFAN
ncbi:MAG: HAD-IIIC family phosphatase, partial [Caulobacteraceae bacterium]